MRPLFLAPSRALTAVRLAPRAVLALTVATAAGMSAWLAPPAAPAADPDLARLLVVFIGLKALIAAAAVAASLWRLGLPASLRATLGYIGAAAALSAGATLLAFGGASLVATLLFHAGLLGFALTALRDRALPLRG